MNLATFERARAKAETALRRPLRLKEIRLPAGDVWELNIGSMDGGSRELKLDPQVWLREGYEGARIIGHDLGTTVRATGYDGIALKVGQHEGCVEFVNLHVVAGHRCATSFGLQPKDEAGRVKHPLRPKFLIRWHGGSVLVPEPSELAGKRAMWGIFGYQFDSVLTDLKIDATFASEHGMYGHGFARWGRLNERLHVLGSGGEGLKERPDALETHYVGPQAFIIDRRVKIKNWYQPWSNRGGAGRVLQGAACHYLAEDCEAWGGLGSASVPSNQRGKGWMFSSEGVSYDVLSGTVDKAGGYGMGLVVMRRCVAAGFSEVEWHNQAVRCGVNGGRMGILGFLMEESGAYGAHRTVEVTGVKAGNTLIRDNNSPMVAERLGLLGVDTLVEATLPLAHERRPLSKGLVR